MTRAPGATVSGPAYCGLGPAAGAAVRAHPADPALLVLAAAQKGAADDLHLEAPLTLHAGRGPVRATAPRPQEAAAGETGSGFFTAEAWRQHGTGATTAGADKKDFAGPEETAADMLGPHGGQGPDGKSPAGTEAGPQWTAAARRFCPWLDRKRDLG